MFFNFLKNNNLKYIYYNNKKNFIKFYFKNNIDKIILYNYIDIIYNANLNFEILNYINLVETLFGIKPLFKEIFITKYNKKEFNKIKSIKKLKLKNKLSPRFKFFIQSGLKLYNFISGLDYIIFFLKFYKIVNKYYNLSKILPQYTFKNIFCYNNYQIHKLKFVNIHLISDFFSNKYVENNCIKFNKLYINIYLKNLDYFKNFN